MAPAPRRITPHRVSAHLCALALLSAATLLLSSCGSFFTCEGKPSCPTTCVASSTVTCPPTGSTTVDYAYVANSSTSTNDVNAYNLSAGTLTNVTGAPFAFNFSPSALVANQANTFLYAATDPALSTGYIYGYSIGTGGSLSILGGGKPQILENDAALALSPDGQWLFTLPSAALIINEYPISASTGALSGAQASFSLSSAPTGTITPLSLAVAPTGQYFAAALGTGGVNVYPFDTATGAIPTGQSGVGINPGSNQIGYYAVAFDTSNYLYGVNTNGLTVFSLTAGAPVGVTALKTYPLGAEPRSIAIASTTTASVTTSTFVYVGNKSDGTISAYSIATGGVLTAVPGSPFTAPPSVSALAIDSTGKYLIASGYDATAGIELYSIGSTGALTSAATAPSGTSLNIPSVIATTH